MITWAEKVYFSENIKERKRNKLKQKIEKGAFTRNTFCITYPTNPDNLLDIFSTGELKYPHYKGLEMKVVGVAKGKENAEEVVRCIVEDMINSPSGLNVQDFFS